jgi:hypothetical protein
MALADEGGGGGLAGFTASLEAGGYGLPEPDPAGHVMHDHGTDGESTSVRTAVHRGHEIRIETTYRVTIDGKPLEGGLEVLDNGAVHYHGLPQYALPSAIDMCKRVLDYFGTAPPAVDDLGCLVGEHGENCRCGHHDHDQHDHDHHDHEAQDHHHHDHGEGLNDRHP